MLGKLSKLLKIDYRKARRQAAELEDIANKIKKISNNDMADCISGISDNWKGDNSDAYQKKCKKVKKNIRDIGQDIERVADVIREIARAAEEAEKRSISIAKTRKSN